MEGGHTLTQICITLKQLNGALATTSGGEKKRWRDAGEFNWFCLPDGDGGFIFVQIVGVWEPHPDFCVCVCAFVCIALILTIQIQHAGVYISKDAGLSHTAAAGP